jgi:hypothetical protein
MDREPRSVSAHVSCFRDAGPAKNNKLFTGYRVPIGSQETFFTHDHSTMVIAYTGEASTNFDVSSRTDTGLSTYRSWPMVSRRLPWP